MSLSATTICCKAVHMLSALYCDGSGAATTAGGSARCPPMTAVWLIMLVSFPSLITLTLT